MTTRKTWLPDPDDYTPTWADHHRCTATRTDGTRCRRNRMKGQTVCAAHGGRSPQAKAKAAERIARQKELDRAMKIIQARTDIDPATALLEAVQYAAGEVDYWRSRVNTLPDEDVAGMLTTKTEEGVTSQGMVDVTTREAARHVYLTELHDAQDRLVRYAAAALKAGIEERRVRVAEQQGHALAEVIRRILTQLNLSPDQQTLVGTVVPAELRAIQEARP